MDIEEDGVMFEYNPMFYNDVVHKLESEWQRKLTDHEKNVLIFGYRYGRYVEMENEIRILDVK